MCPGVSDVALMKVQASTGREDKPERERERERGSEEGREGERERERE